jgi:hypothetical protein
MSKRSKSDYSLAIIWSLLLFAVVSLFSGCGGSGVSGGGNDQPVQTGSISGYVKDENGNYVEGVVVTVIDESEQSDGATSKALSTVTDKNGYYEITGVTTGDRILDFYDGKAGYGYRLPINVAVGNTQIAETQLEPVGDVTGKVTESVNNKALSGVKVSIAITDWNTYASGASNNNGSYEIPNVKEGTHTITALKSGYISQTSSITVKHNETNTKDFCLNPGTSGGGTVAGTITDENGDPIMGALATVTTTGSKATYSDLSDNSGVFLLDAVPSGEWPLTISADGYATSTLTVTVLEGQTTEVPLIVLSVGGSGNVAGKVYSQTVGGTVIAEATVALGETTCLSSSDGSYTLNGVPAGSQTLSATANGYIAYLSTIIVVADATVTKDIAMEISATGTPTPTATIGTYWASRRLGLPEVNNDIDADVNDDGTKIAFVSDGNVILNWNNPVGISQVYVYSRINGTITRISNNNNVLGSTAGANANSQAPAISGDGNYVVFQSSAQDILADGLATGNIGDIFIVKLADLSISRVTSSIVNPLLGGNAQSSNPDINGDGTKVVFQSLATNIGGTTHTAAYSHVYYVAVNNMSVGVRRMLDISIASVEGSDGGVNPQSANPSISYDGRYTAFQSLASNITSAGAGVPDSTVAQIFRNDINIDPVAGWNTHVSKHNGTTAGAACALPVICEGGSKIAFQSASVNLGNPTATGQNIYLWNVSDSALTYVSVPLVGAVGNNTNAMIDRSGRYVGFLSTTVGLVPDVTDSIARVYVKDMNAGTNQYTLVSRGSSDQLPDVACDAPTMSGDSYYVVWQTAAKNLTADSYTAGIIDVFIRKWR